MKPSLLNISKAMAFATAIGAASAAWATVFPGSTDFEDVTLPDDYTEEAAAVISQIDTPPDVASRPAHYNYASSRTNVLEIDTGADAPVFRELNADGTAEEGTIYVDMLVKPTAIFAPDASPTPGSTDKLLVYFKEYPAGTTNLCVYAGYNNDGLTNGECLVSAQLPVDKDKWYRLVIEAKEVDYYPCFNVYLGGYGTDFLCKRNGDPDFYSLLIPDNYDPENPLPSAVAKVGFAGSGFVDDFVASDIDPDAVVTVSCTLSWPTTLTSVSYTLDGEDGDALTIANGSATIQGTNGAPVTLTGSIGYASKTVNGSISENGTISLPAIDISYYFPLTATADQDGTAEHPYEIADVNGLYALQAAVAAGKAGNLVYAQTANIDFTGEAPFAGIGTYAANLNSGVAFTGTYDGQGYKISNIDFTQRNYGGVFNQVKGGTIKNLTVENITCSGFNSSANSGEWGCAIVGNAGQGATLNGLTAMGTFGSAGTPCTHNVAGIVIRTCGGASNTVNNVKMLETLVKDCTNNATLYGSYTKCAGICALSQDQNGVANDYVLFDGCVNNANIAMVAGKGTEGRDGLSGIIGYVSDGTKIKDCVNNGTLTSVLATAKIGGIVGWAQGRTLDDLGGNKNPAAAKMIGDPSGSTITGFKYATVDNDVATTIPPPYTLAANETYLLEGNVAASETPVATLTAVGDTIAFDTARGYTFAGTVGNSGAAGIPTVTTKGTVTYYTAGYFPRTDTAGQDGTAEHPFEIADLDDLQALQAAVANDVGRDLAYVQTDDIALTAAWPGIGVDAGKDKTDAAYAAGAFAGTYDGGNYTISNFSMVDGVDYGGLFNSINNATVKNLKMSWGSSTLCSNSSSSGDDTGATFVGTAKGSTLQNLTALAGTVTTVTASKDMAGIVGYVYAGSTIEACTNELNITSFKTSRKCGGIAIITQLGSGNAIFRNCYNSGTVTTPGTAYREGGIVGYVNVATTIDGCENTANVKLFHVEGSPIVTVTGTNKGYAGVASNDKGVSGLYFATVSGDVATFVADNALALNGEYKVMSTGATATFNFTAPGTISFDTNLVQAVTFAITAAEELTLTDATANGVVTYTATGAGDDDDYVVTINGSDVVITPSAEDLAAVQAAVIAGGGTLDVTDVAAVNAALAAEIGSTGIPSWQALFLGLPPTEAGLESFKIASISFNEDGEIVMTLPAAVSPKTGRGVNIALNLMGSDDLSSWTFIEAATGTTFAPVMPASGETKKFYKVVAVFSATDAE